MAEAIWFPAKCTVEIRQEQAPPLGSGQVRVQALVSGISHGTELLVYRGQVPSGLPLDLPTLAGSYDFPIKFGYASVGRVMETGKGVTCLAPGDLVFSLHPHQTEYVVAASYPVLLPSGLPPERGVFLANMETAVNILLDAAPRIGERVAVFGQGVIGLLLVQLLRRAGAGYVLAVDPLPLRRERALALGADVALEPNEGLLDAVRSASDGQGVDVAIEASGQPAALEQAIAVTAAQGTVVVSSWYGTKPVTLDLGSHFHRGRLRIISSQVGAIDPALSGRWNQARRTALARDLLAQLPLEQLITQQIPFRRAPEAYALIDCHPEETVEVVLSYGAGDV